MAEKDTKYMKIPFADEYDGEESDDSQEFLHNKLERIQKGIKEGWLFGEYDGDDDNEVESVRREDGKSIFEITNRKNIDFEEDRYCPVFNSVIDCEFCYEVLWGITGGRKRRAVRELDELTDEEIKSAYIQCKKCKYSEMGDD